MADRFFIGVTTAIHAVKSQNLLPLIACILNTVHNRNPSGQCLRSTLEVPSSIGFVETFAWIKLHSDDHLISVSCHRKTIALSC